MDPADFTIGWICALPIELAAAQGMLEEEYDVQNNPPDTDQYCLGKIAGHKIVLTCLVSAGTTEAGFAASHMQHTFQNLDFILMVGIGGGIPGSNTGQDVRLGDVVVSMPSGAYGGVIQYDIGKFLENGFQRTGALQGPPRRLQKVIRRLEANHERQENCVAQYVGEMLRNTPNYTQPETNYSRPSREKDLLFKTEYKHVGDSPPCTHCHKDQLIARHDRDKDQSKIHYGNIVSGNGLIRDAKKRDDLGKEYGALCVEMEAAGLMGEFQCLVIRGICDYSDSHKNDDWQRYAAAAAAAYAKELLHAMQSKETLNRSQTGSEHLDSRGTVNSGPSTKHESPPPSQAVTSHPSPGEAQVQSPQAKPSVSPRISFAGPSHLPYQSTDDLPLLSQSPSTHSTQPGYRDSPQCPSFDEPILSNTPPKMAPSAPDRHAWEAREGEYILIDIASDQYESYRPEKQNPYKMRRCDLRIFELVNATYYISTRRLAVRSREHEEQCVSYWMPLDNVRVETEDRQLTISWSDCAHIRSATKSYQTTFKCQYIPDDRNHRLRFDFEDAEVMRRLADVLLLPTLKHFHCEPNGVRIGRSSSDHLRVYKYRPGAVSSKSRVDQHPEFAILISSTPARSSKIYFGQASLDFWQDEVRDQFIVKNMRCLMYTSSLERPSEEDLERHVDPEGRPDGLDWKREDLALSLIEFNLKNFLKMLTGWQLLFSENAPDAIIKSGGTFARPKKMKDAWVTLWEKEAETSQDLQLLIRTSNASGEFKEGPWLSTCLTSAPIELTSPDVTAIEIKDQACLRDFKTNIRLHFSKSDHRKRFYDAIEFLSPPLRRPTSVGD